MKSKIILFFLFSTLLKLNLFAQEVNIKDSVIISAFRIKQVKAKTPYSALALDLKEEEKNGKRTIPEALSNIAGVFIQKTNHGGGSAFIRGLTGNQNLILIDGIRLNNSTFRYGPNQYLNTVDYYSVAKIEVLKGNGSVQYGSDALSGVIQLFSKEAELSNGKVKWESNTTLKTLSKNMEQSIHSDLSFSSKKVATTIGFTARNFGDLYGGDTTGIQSPSGYKEQSYNVFSKFQITKNSNLIFSSRGMFQHEIPFYYKMQLENYQINQIKLQSHQLNYVKYAIETKNQFFQSINTTLSYQNSIENKETQKNDNAVLTTEINKINTLGFSIDVQSQINQYWRINSGVERYQDQVRSSKSEFNTNTAISNYKRGLYPDGASYHNISVFSLHEIQLKKQNIQFGIRYNTFDINIDDTTLGHVQLKPNAMVYNIAYINQLSRNHAIYTSINTAYRAPNIDDMGTLGIVDFRYEVPSKNLKPENSMNYEIGHRYHNANVSSEIAFYYMQLHNIITRTKVVGEVINGYNVYTKNNNESAMIKGIEHNLQIKISSNIQLSNYISYTYGQNITLNEPMRRIPPMNGLAKIRYEKNKFYSNIAYQYASKQDRLSSGDKSDNRIDKNGSPAWNVIDFNTGYQLKNITINTGIQNILNADYRTHGSGINGMGRCLWLSLNIKI